MHCDVEVWLVYKLYKISFFLNKVADLNSVICNYVISASQSFFSSFQV